MFFNIAACGVVDVVRRVRSRDISVALSAGIWGGAGVRGGGGCVCSYAGCS